MLKEHRSAALIITLFAVLRIVTSLSMGLGFDESHYVLYAWFLDLSYFDHPPLVGWLQWPLLKLFGPSDLGARLPAILLFSYTSVLCYQFLLKNFADKKAAIWGLIALNASLLLNVLGIMLLPDSLLLVLVFLLLNNLENLRMNREITKHWINLGLILGLCGLSKYTSVLFVVPVLGFFYMEGMLSKKFIPKLALAGAIALSLISPVLIWNYKHDWMSFKYQGHHLFSFQDFSFRHLAAFFGSQWVSYGPILSVLSFWGIFNKEKFQTFQLKFARNLAWIVFLFFFISSFSGSPLPHWTGVFYVLFIPISGALLVKRNLWFMKMNFGTLLIGLSLALNILIYVFILVQPDWFPPFQSPFRDVGRYRPLMDEVNLELEKNTNPNKAIGVTNWSIASRVYLYNIGHTSEVQLFDERVDQFDIFNPKSYEGYDILFMNSHTLRKDLATYPCKKLEPTRVVDLLLRGISVDRYELVWCRSFGI